jgi:hypothetical protein
MAVVVGVAAGLVNAPPAKTEVAMHGPVEQELRLAPELMAHLSVMPAMPGTEAGAYRVMDANLSLAGDWRVRIEARVGEFELFTKDVTVPIEEE